MLTLAELQAQFSAGLLNPAADAIDHWVVAIGIAAPRRRAVYRNNIRIAHGEALSGIYPVISRLVGEKFFAYLAEQYDLHHPSTSGDLREYGAALARFLSTFGPVARLPYLPDVARLEWAWHECFHAAAAPSIEPAELAALAAEPDRCYGLSLIPAARLLASDYPVAEIWLFALDPERQQRGLDLDVLQPARLLIWRRDERVEVMELTPAQFFWLDRLSRHDNLPVAFEQTSRRYPQFDFTAALVTFVRLGVLAKDRV